MYMLTNMLTRNGIDTSKAIWNLNSCEDIMEFASKFSKILRESLPLACDGRTSRLQTINKFASIHWNDKYFV